MAATDIAVKDDTKKLSRKFNGVVHRAQAAIFCERAWPKIVPTACVGGLFASASWLGLWGHLPPAGRIAGVALFAAVAVASPFLVKTGSLLPSRKEAVARIDKIANHPERPAQTLNDKLPPNSDDATRKIWEAHQKNVGEKWAGKLQPGKPRSDMPKRDPWKLRFGIMVLTAASAAVAGIQGEFVNRLTEAFNWKSPPPVIVPVQAKAAVSPPDYTKQDPFYLTPGDNKAVPEGSLLIITTEKGPISIARSGGGAIPAPKTVVSGDPGSEKQITEYDIALTAKDSCFAVLNGPKWCLSVTPDQAPTVTLDSAKPSDKNPNTIQIACRASDDYPDIQDGQVIIEPPVSSDPKAKPLTGALPPPIPLPGGPNGPCPAPGK